MKIIRVSDTTVPLWDLSYQLRSKNIQIGDKFGISWKKGKNRKLRSYRLVDHTVDKCECCGTYDIIRLRKGDKVTQLDNHFGISSLSINTTFV